MQKSKLFFNSVTAIGQVLVVGIAYFVLYRYLLDTIGIDLLGVWSLIIASTSLALLANFGISTSIVKFVSTYYTRQDFESLKKLIFTSVIFIIVTYMIMSLLILILGYLILPYFIEKKYIVIALEILPFSLVSLVINALAGVLSSCLDGIQKNYLKSYIVSLSTILLVVLSVLLTPKWGLKGLVYAQIAQACVVLVAAALAISRNIEGVFTWHWNWSNILFKEIINYGIKMQALSFMQMSFEPVTKALLSKFGGLAAVGYYEMASRFVSQIRGLIVSANQVIVPVVAAAKEADATKIKKIYIDTFSIILVFNIVLTTAIVVVVPAVSCLWIGQYVPFFVFAVLINSVVAFVNISSNPAYFSYLGEGQLNYLIYSYAIISVLNPVLGYFLGQQFGAYGVVVAWNFAFLLGSLLVLFSYQKTHKIFWRQLFKFQDLILIIVAIINAVIGFDFAKRLFEKDFDILLFITFLFCVTIFVFLLLNNPRIKSLNALFFNKKTT